MEDEDNDQNYEDYNDEEDYNDYNEEDIEDNNKEEEKNIKNEINLNEQPIKDYEIIQNSEIIKKRDIIIQKFIEFSNLSYDEAELVLIYYDWNYDKLMEYWFDNIEKISIESHICQSEESKKLETEPNSIVMTPCPLKGCNLFLTRTIFKKCITEKKYQRIFAKSLVRNFIARNNNIKPCPNPRCNLSIRVPVSLAKEIKCNCGWNFCYLCLEESHVPCDCEMAKLWKESTREKGSGEDFIWMTENTKNCPKCGTNIEKNQGCNHMTCQRRAGGKKKRKKKDKEKDLFLKNLRKNS